LLKGYSADELVKEGSLKITLGNQIHFRQVFVSMDEKVRWNITV